MPFACPSRPARRRERPGIVAATATLTEASDRSRSARAFVHGLLTVTVGFAVLAAPAVATAQEGTVTYTQVVKREAPSFGGQRGAPPGFGGGQQFTPPPRTATAVLHFGPSGWVMTMEEGGGGRGGGGGGGQRFRGGDGGGFDRPPSDGARGGFARGGGRFGLAGAVGSDPYAATQLRAAYVDPEAGTVVEARGFLGRNFRVTRERPSLQWQLTSEQAEHLGYMVMKATAQQDSATTVEAWFTPQIPVQGGPESYGGLPGLILVLSVNDGQVQYQAAEVVLGELEEGLIHPPDEGDEMEQEEFEQLVRERLEEMIRNRRPPGGDDGHGENEQ